MSNKSKYNVNITANSTALICAKCNAVSFTSDGLCEVQGKVTKGDWCGLKHDYPPSLCKQHIHKNRYKCAKCGQVSINPELLCEPESYNE